MASFNAIQNGGKFKSDTYHLIHTNSCMNNKPLIKSQRFSTGLQHQCSVCMKYLKAITDKFVSGTSYTCCCHLHSSITVTPDVTRHHKSLFQGWIQGGPGGPGPQPPKMRPQHQNSTKLRPQNGSFRPLNKHFFQKLYPHFVWHKLLTSNYLNFFQAHYTHHCLMHVCIHASVYFIFIGSHKLYIIQCTFIMNIAL